MDYAERCSKAILFLMNALGAQTREIVPGGPNTVTEGSSGVYMLWLVVRTGAGDLIPSYPTYVGHTSRSLATRISEHINGGKIAEIFATLPSTTGLNIATVDHLNVVYIPVPNSVAAAMLEALFLSQFDFAQNTALNAAPRPIDTIGGEEAGDVASISDIATARGTEIIVNFCSCLSDALQVVRDWDSRLRDSTGRNG